MNIRETVFNLQKIYEEMSTEFGRFQSETGLTCPTGCGKCCLYPEIEASVLECLPLAMDIFQNGKPDDWLENTSIGEKICLLWEGDRLTGRGRCSAYEFRPTICRVFGASGYFNKHHQVSLSICKHIKETQTITAEVDPQNIPMIMNWNNLVEELGSPSLLKKIPINEAIREALQLIGFYAQYQNEILVKLN